MLNARRTHFCAKSRGIYKAFTMKNVSFGASGVADIIGALFTPNQLLLLVLDSLVAKH